MELTSCADAPASEYGMLLWHKWVFTFIPTVTGHVCIVAYIMIINIIIVVYCVAHLWLYVIFIIM